MAKKVAEDAPQYTPHSGKPAPAGKPSPLLDTRVIYCGDNLDLLPKLPDACVDLIYIDPPFNSNRNYEVFWGEKKEKRSFEDRHESTKAYIEFMRPRCLELHRVLKPTGSFYCHCDWHASHYVKVMLDGIFGENSFVNEIIWKRTTTHGDTKLGYSAVTDSILFYVGAEKPTWKPQHEKHDAQYLADKYHYDDGDGRGPYALDNMTSPNPRPNMMYEWKGHASPSKGWRYSQETMAKLDADKRIWYPPTKDKRPRLKRYLKEMPGPVMGNLWDDIPPINSQAIERLGYPTQKPLALLERIIAASSNKNDVVLDAFCGCGTALVAAQKLGRLWIGIDMSPTACEVMGKRLRDVCKLSEGEDLRAAGRGFAIRDLPKTEKELRKMPPFEFQNWVNRQLRAIPGPRGADGGIDGRFFFADSPPNADPSALGFMDDWYPVQVKQEDKAGRPDMMSFEAVMTRDKRKTGYFVAFGYTQDALDEARRFMLSDHRHIIPLIVSEILDGSFAEKMA